MKSFNKVIIVAFAVIVLMFAMVNVIPRASKSTASILNIEVNRAVREIEQSGNIPETDKYKTVLAIVKQSGEEDFLIPIMSI